MKFKLNRTVDGGTVLTRAQTVPADPYLTESMLEQLNKAQLIELVLDTQDVLHGLSNRYKVKRDEVQLEGDKDKATRLAVMASVLDYVLNSLEHKTDFKINNQKVKA